MTVEPEPRRVAVLYPGLDVIRLAAALLVAFFHMTTEYAALHPGSWVLSSGWIGVQVFFVISGFVISYTADNSTARRFIVNRAARLYPATWIATVITLLVAPQPIGNIIRTVTLSPVGPWVSGVFWTLAIEILFYALVALCLWRGWSLYRLALVIGTVSLIHWTGRIVGIRIPIGYAVYGCFFALGMLLYQRRNFPFGLAMFVTCVAGCYLMFPERGPQLNAMLIWTACALAIVASVKWNHHLTWLKSRTIGLMTYPLYLIHTPVGDLFVAFGVLPAVAASLAASFAILPLERGIRGRLLRAAKGSDRSPAGK